MSSDKCIIEFMKEKEIVCPCIKQNYTGPLYPGFVQSIYNGFLNVKHVDIIDFLCEKNDCYSVVAFLFHNDENRIYLAEYIKTKADAVIILHEIMRIITMR